MTRTPMTAALAATISACLLAPAGAGATDTIHYRVGMDLRGTWSESVRADLDPDDVDHDGTEDVAVRDSTIAYALRAAMPDVALRGGRVVTPAYDVADATLTQDVKGSAFTDFYGTSGTCSAQNQGATGGGTVANAGGGIVFRPSSDAVLDLECVDPYVKFSMSVDLLRVAASKDVAELGGAPLDVGFAVPPKRFGDWRVTIPVSATAAQRAFDRCPREDPGHTVACPFGWDGTVTLDRLTPEVTGARVVRGGRAVSLTVRCADSCRPKLRAGGSSKSYRIAPGAPRRLTLPLRAADRRSGNLRISVTIGDDRTTIVARPAA